MSQAFINQRQGEVTFAKEAIVLHLLESGQATRQELAKQLSLYAATVGQSLSRLSALGYTTRQEFHRIGQHGRCQKLYGLSASGIEQALRLELERKTKVEQGASP